MRNLETAQGDERDIILIGVGFGPTEPEGKTMSMGFGKLNTDGGWRRLNVAVTRARAEMVLFTSFDPAMIDLTRTSQKAVADLKRFVEYAYRGPRAIAQASRGSVGGADSPFEQAVAAELYQRGWTVIPQVGVSQRAREFRTSFHVRECDAFAYAPLCERSRETEAPLRRFRSFRLLRMSDRK